MPTISRPRLVFREPHANSMNIRAHRLTGPPAPGSGPTSPRPCARSALPRTGCRRAPSRARRRAIEAGMPATSTSSRRKGERSSRARNRPHQRRHPPWNRGWCTVARQTTLRNNALQQRTSQGACSGSAPERTLGVTPASGDHAEEVRSGSGAACSRRGIGFLQLGQDHFTPAGQGIGRLSPLSHRERGRGRGADVEEFRYRQADTHPSLTPNPSPGGRGAFSHSSVKWSWVGESAG